MFFQKKLDRSYDTMRYLSGEEKETEEELKGFREREKLEFKDVLAMVISAVLVFGPLFLIIGIIMFILTL